MDKNVANIMHMDTADNVSTLCDDVNWSIYTL